MREENSPRNVEECKERMEEYNSNSGRILFPQENLPEYFFEVFHEFMSSENSLKIEYIQENIHSGHFREEFFSSPEEIREDFRIYKNSS